MWRNDKTIEAPGRLENLKELVGAVAEFDTLAGFLEHVSLVMEALEAEGGSMVSVMTLHAAKGLEFDIVFLARLGGRPVPPTSAPSTRAATGRWRKSAAWPTSG